MKQLPDETAHWYLKEDATKRSFTDTDWELKPQPEKNITGDPNRMRHIGTTKIQTAYIQTVFKTLNGGYQCGKKKKINIEGKKFSSKFSFRRGMSNSMLNFKFLKC